MTDQISKTEVNSNLVNNRESIEQVIDFLLQGAFSFFMKCFQRGSRLSCFFFLSFFESCFKNFASPDKDF